MAYHVNSRLNGSGKHSNNRRLMPTIYLIVILALTIVPYFILNIPVIPAPFTYLGIILIGFGIGMNLWSSSTFKSRKTPVAPVGASTTLVADGPYRISRNPMYLGVMAILFGLAIFMGSLTTFVFPVIFFLIVETLFIPVEEKSLEDKFGKEYEAYNNKVRRWI